MRKFTAREYNTYTIHKIKYNNIRLLYFAHYDFEQNSNVLVLSLTLSNYLVSKNHSPYI